MVKRLICAAAALALATLTYTSAHAAYSGVLRRNLPFTLSVTSASTDTVAVTVYYLDHRGISAIEFMSVSTPGVAVWQEFAKPGKFDRRVIIEIDPPSGGTASVRIDQFPPVNVEGDTRVVFDVF